MQVKINLKSVIKPKCRHHLGLIKKILVRRGWTVRGNVWYVGKRTYKDMQCEDWNGEKYVYNVWKDNIQPYYGRVLNI